jgi:signal transduction histidine kinase
VSGILILIAGGGVFWIRQRAKIKLQQTKLEAAQRIIETEENEKERNAMELHDAVGSLVFKLSETVSHSMVQDPLSKQAIDLHIGEFKDEIRNISHRMNKHLLQHQPIDSLLKTFLDDTIRYGKLNLKYVVDKPKKTVKNDVAIHLFRIVQELINNARKYAGNAEIKIAVLFFEESFELTYSDNGTGFSLNSGEQKGMGFSNIRARVNLINGNAELDSEPGRGVYWKITAPTDNT